jgi:uncharacterized protein
VKNGQRYFDSGSFGNLRGNRSLHSDLSDEEKGASLTLKRQRIVRQTTEPAEECAPMPQKERQVFVYNKSKETFLAFRVKVADSILGRLVGLLGKRSLKPDSGVWIVPANAIHTMGMLFSFDLVLIDKNFKVVGLREMIRPFRITRPNFRAESVLELPAHTIFKSRTEVGDQLVIERFEAKTTRPEPVETDAGLPAPSTQFEPIRTTPRINNFVN